jgi:hypothetical protein
MEYNPTDPSADASFGVPYSEASFSQVSVVLATIYEELKNQFFALPWLYWSNALNRLQPDLLVEATQVTISAADLLKLTKTLASYLDSPQPDSVLSEQDSWYLARRFAEHEEKAVLALDEMEANPVLYGSHSGALIMKLAAGNGVVSRVLETFTGSSTLQQRPGYSLPTALVPGNPAVIARLQALAETRKYPY